ncbi:MAG TPA: type II toxin-antitoxin system PemK/MazF family toxin [Chloroflexota bacterium]|nr:type II toxin-antitoxin system PemK/MazF family toxin [Chloroflexota bacterium]
MSRPAEGAIVLVDWRGGALPREPTGIRPAAVVEGAGKFPDDFENLLVVPFTRDQTVVYPAFSLRIDPTPENGAHSVCWALAHHVSSVSMRRVRATASRITRDQLDTLRERIVLAIGLLVA